MLNLLASEIFLIITDLGETLKLASALGLQTRTCSGFKFKCKCGSDFR